MYSDMRAAQLRRYKYISRVEKGAGTPRPHRYRLFRVINTVFGTKKFSVGAFQRRGSLANITVIPI